MQGAVRLPLLLLEKYSNKGASVWPTAEVGSARRGASQWTHIAVASGRPEDLDPLSCREGFCVKGLCDGPVHNPPVYASAPQRQQQPAPDVRRRRIEKRVVGRKRTAC